MPSWACHSLVPYLSWACTTELSVAHPAIRTRASSLLLRCHGRTQPLRSCLALLPRHVQLKQPTDLKLETLLQPDITITTRSISEAVCFRLLLEWLTPGAACPVPLQHQSSAGQVLKGRAHHRHLPQCPPQHRSAQVAAQGGKYLH